MTENKTLTAILAIISIFLLGAVAFGLTQIDGINNKNSTNQINKIESVSPNSNNNQKASDSTILNTQSVEASKISEPPRKEVSATKENIETTNKKDNIIETANANPDISIFVSAVKAAGIEEILQSEGPFTVFAPNNEAFTKYLPEETLADLQKPENKDKLAGLLKGHITTPKFASTDLQNGQYLATQYGGQLLVKVAGDQYFIDDIFITKPNIESTNGVIHVINRIIPE
jgi:uncharacterized surface protein with fasciclin (FAS1) repeats